jgi:hypothetical protein
MSHKQACLVLGTNGKGKTKVLTYQGCREALGGYVQVVRTRDYPNLVLLVNDRLEGRMPNPRATHLVDGREVVGDAILAPLSVVANQVSGQ